MKTYFIKSDYVHRTSYNYFDDTSNKDEWQKEVYAYARKLFDEKDFQTVLDVGCGSAFKLIKNFNDVSFIGVDVEETIQKLKIKYPQYIWSTTLENINNIDLVICSDVIEHIVDPDDFIANIKKINSKLMIFSTPERDLLKSGHSGPPKNLCHIREWNFKEFFEYMQSHFEVLDHFVSNEIQATQLVLVKNKH